ncbi:MAG TPA: arsenate reductase ArsC [Usitatibacter sp.]|nr:arsenate reductase ArsC [Usitatibacter sp.]
MAERQGHVYNVLFLCTGNSARSILAEAMLNHLGKGRFRAYSAGSHPAGKVNPFATELLEAAHLPTEGLRSKAWDEFAKPGAPPMDIILTVCDNAAGEACPVWPGKPVTAHWGVADPAAAQGSDGEKRAAFRAAANVLRHRIELLASLPLAKLDELSIQSKLRELGKA